MKRNKPISDLSMRSRNQVLQSVKALRKFQFVDLIEIINGSKVVVVLDILEFKQAGLPMQTYRQWVTVEQVGATLTGYTFGFGLTFASME